ncbi:Imm41 family immunity protein, partial [Acinetobacter pittii]
MDAKEIILRNFPHNNLYDDLSFLGKLNEEQSWDIEEYWLLEWGVYKLEKNSPEKLDWEIFRIF